MDVIKVADHIIDLGPEGGDGGGRILFEGTPEDMLTCKESYTADFLKKELL
jgi:excinuclease ABC subunit A